VLLCVCGASTFPASLPSLFIDSPCAAASPRRSNGRLVEIYTETNLSSINFSYLSDLLLPFHYNNMMSYKLSYGGWSIERLALTRAAAGVAWSSRPPPGPRRASTCARRPARHPRAPCALRRAPPDASRPAPPRATRTPPAKRQTPRSCCPPRCRAYIIQRALGHNVRGQGFEARG